MRSTEKTATLTDTPFSLGGNIFGWTLDGEQAFDVFDSFVERGGVAFDVADSYTQWAPGGRSGRAEKLLGRWLARGVDRARVHVTSKVGIAENRPGLSRANILAAVDESLERLRTDYIDVYYGHRDDPDTDLRETLTTFHELVLSGRVRALGYSHISSDRLDEAQRIVDADGLTPITHLQHLYNIIDHETFERDFAGRPGFTFLGFHSLASGFLTGKYAENPKLETEHTAKIRATINDPRAPRLQQALRDIALKHGVSGAAIALAWFRTRDVPIIPLASARSIEQLDDLLAASSVQLDDDDVRRLVW